jgi:hypothetical protein
VLPLDYAFMRNAEKYPDPDKFRPERWIKKGWPTYLEPLTKFPTVKGMTSFGWGQRRCLGQSITQDELVVACGGLLWAFHLKHKVDPQTGQKVAVSADKSNSLLIVKPDPFQMVFEPRSAERKAEVVEQWKMAERKDTEDRAAFVLREHISEALSDLTSEMPGVPETIKATCRSTVVHVCNGYDESARPGPKLR